MRNISPELKKCMIEAFRRIEAGESSYGKEADQLGIGQGTLHRRHMKHYEKQIQAAKGELMRIEGQTKQLRTDFELLEPEYEKKKERLQKEFENQKAALESEVAKLKSEAAQVKAIFKNQGLTWSEGVQIVLEIENLSAWKKHLIDQNKQLEDENSRLSKAAKQERLVIRRMKQETDRLSKEHSIKQRLVEEDVGLLRHFDEKIMVKEREIRSLEDQRGKIQEDIINVEAELQRDKEALQKLGDEIELIEKTKKQALSGLKKTREENAVVSAETQKLVKEAKENIEEMEALSLREVRETKARELKEIQQMGKQKATLKAEIETMKAEKQLLEAARKAGYRTSHVKLLSVS